MQDVRLNTVLVVKRLRLNLHFFSCENHMTISFRKMREVMADLTSQCGKSAARAVAHAISSQVPHVQDSWSRNRFMQGYNDGFFLIFKNKKKKRFGVMISVICVSLYLCFLFCLALRLDCILYFYLGTAEIRVHL